MLKQQGFLFALRPTPHQERLFRQVCGASRYIWNRALALQKARLDQGEKLLSRFDLCRELTAWRRDPATPWLAEMPVAALRAPLRALSVALRDAFRKTSPKRFPRFKKKGRHDGFGASGQDAFAVSGDRVRLPKVGWVRFRKSREIEGVAKNVAVARRGGRWFVAIQCEREVPDPVHPSVSAVGVDMGVRRFATLSDGSFFEPLNSFKRLEKRLALEQRRLSRKVKFSQNWRKQKAKVERVHVRIADARRDYLHKISTAISKNHAVVVLEDLRVSNMSASAKGTVEEPGCNVAAKAGLNKAILDQGWAEFRRMLEYKQAWRGGRVQVVHSAYTSQTCGNCGCVDAESRMSQSKFLCTSCGFESHADMNAACNILRAGGHPVPARGGFGISQPMKREPLVQSGILGFSAGEDVTA